MRTVVCSFFLLTANLMTQVYVIETINGKGLINRQGEVIVPPQEKRQFLLLDGPMIAYSDDWLKWGYMDLTGKIRIPPQFDLCGPFQNGYATVRIGETFKVIDERGRFLPLENNFSLTGYSEGFWLGAGSSVMKPIHYYDSTGRVYFSNNTDNSFEFSEGLSCVGVDRGNERLFGYLDKKGNYAIKPQFALAYSFKDGIAVVRESVTQTSFIDRTGKILFRLPENMQTLGFSEGLADISNADGTTAYFIDRSWQIVVRPATKYAYPFCNGLSRISDKTPGQLSSLFDPTLRDGYMDRNGRVIISQQYNFSESFHNGLAFVRRFKTENAPGEEGYIDTSGKFVWKRDPNEKKEESKPSTVWTFELARKFLYEKDVRGLRTALPHIRSEINNTDKAGLTLLTLAALTGQEEAIRVLVKNGAEVNLKNKQGQTALECARSEGHQDVVKLLLELGAKESDD